MKFTDSLLVKYTFLELLEREFGIELKEKETEKIELAKQSIEIYDSMEKYQSLPCMSARILCSNRYSRPDSLGLSRCHPVAS